MEIILFVILVIIAIILFKMYTVLTDISESLRLLSNNPKTIQEARKVRLQTNKLTKVKQ